MLKRKEEEKILDVNASMKGDLVFSDPVNLRINGKFQGNLTVKGNLIIGESADVYATIIGENIIIAGKVRGKIKMTGMIALSPRAEVYADIETPQLAIEKGAIFNGRCVMQQEKMSLPQLSDYLSIEENKIMEWVEKGKIPVEKNGKDLFFDPKTVETWINQNS